MRDIESGLIYFNAPTTGAEIQMPFGGMKASGNGHRELGTSAVDEFSETKSIFVSYPARKGQKAVRASRAPAIIRAPARHAPTIYEGTFAIGVAGQIG